MQNISGLKILTPLDCLNINESNNFLLYKKKIQNKKPAQHTVLPCEVITQLIKKLL